MSGDQHIEFLPNRLNRQPVIFRGMTNAEIFTLAAIGAVVGLGIGILTTILVGDWILIPTCMLILPIVAVVLGGKTVARLKRGKPETWFLRHLQWIKATWLSNPYFINPRLSDAWVWSLRRQSRQFRQSRRRTSK